MEVVKDGKCQGLVLKGNPVRGNQSTQRDQENEGGVQPVDVLVPILHGYGQLRYVWFPQVVLLRPDGLVVSGAIGEGLGLLYSR